MKILLLKYFLQFSKYFDFVMRTVLIFQTVQGKNLFCLILNLYF